MDVMYGGGLAVLWALMFGLVEVCDRLERRT